MCIRDRFSPMDGDTIAFNISGINPTTSDTTLFFEMVMESEVDISSIEATTYPYLKLEYFVKDDINRTPPQLDFWRVIYEGIPEAAVNANNLFTFYNDTIQRGENISFEIALENISNYDMDSLLVKYTLTDDKNLETISEQRLAPLLNNQVTTTTFSTNSKSFTGAQKLTMEINPDKDQAELFHFNNFAFKNFFIDNDKENPIVDVTFDGIHIMNGDIISPQPTIVITLKDENQFLELSDTSVFKVFIKTPNQELGNKINFNDEAIIFTPASFDNSSKNQATIRYQPNFIEDGTYELIVQSEDISGNQSGDTDYKVNFQIVNKKAISNVLNYPNPFSTSTQFVYTLTGSEPPSYFKIQIMTVSGKIVREITQDELGPMKIGTHRTEYKWDGTDEYGGRLANGVYLYRIVAKDINGQDLEEYETGTSQFFKNDFGKMVIMR